MTDFNSLVPVTEIQFNGKLQQTVSAKQLHSFLNVKNDVSTWIKGRIEQYEFKQSDDFLTFDSSEFRNQSTNNEQLNKWKTKRGGDRRSIDYILTIGTAKELAIAENNEQGRTIRKYFIQCEEHLKQAAPKIQKSELKRLKSRMEVADYSRPMCDALTMQRLQQGKETKPHHYTNEFYMLNKLVISMTAKQYRQTHNITGDIRDHFNEQMLNHLAYLERSNITLIDLGWNYEQRKAELTKLSQAYMIRLLGEIA